MTKDEAISHFGSQIALAKALDIEQPSISEWDGVPPLRQLQLERLTRGKLKADSDCIPAPAKVA